MTYTCIQSSSIWFCCLIITGCLISKNGLCFKRCVKFSCKEHARTDETKSNEKINQNKAGFALSDYKSELVACTVCVQTTVLYTYLANKRLPLTTATLSEVYPIWQQSMYVNWIDNGIGYITVSTLRLRMDI